MDTITNEQIADNLLTGLDVNRKFLTSQNSVEALNEVFAEYFQSNPERLLKSFVLNCKPEDFASIKTMIKKSYARSYVKHVVGELQEGVQRCVICGEVINDYRNIMYPAEQGPPKGFALGDLYVSGGNPKMYSQTIEEFDSFTNCTS